MEKQEKLLAIPVDNKNNIQKNSTELNAGKIDMSRSITEDPGNGEGDRSDTNEMEKLGGL